MSLGYCTVLESKMNFLSLAFCTDLEVKEIVSLRLCTELKLKGIKSLSTWCERIHLSPDSKLCLRDYK